MPMAMPRTAPVVEPADGYFTVEMVDALNELTPKGEWYECVYGELFHVTPPRLWHAVVVDRLCSALRAYAEHEPAAGWVSGQQAKITFQRRDTNVSPDVWAVRREEMRALDWNGLTGLLLAAEVLSPSTKRRDRFTKRRLYQNQGVPLVWIVDADAHLVEVWTPDADLPHVERERLVWAPEGAREPFAMALAELFAPL